MLRNAALAAIILIVPTSFATPAQAQDIGPALDPGILSGTLANDHITQLERARARGYRTHRGSAGRTAQTCANVPMVRRRLGASDPRVRRLAALCRQQGY